ncbi:Ribonuclease R [bioreactor metagenome]|uniref:Ribonuclease R n=1 Tax=bioreactor metagenome TaxID=1076179 RepID=A0A645DSN1_9ZZZZ
MLPLLRSMAELASVLRRRRMARGSLDLETREVYIHCNPAGAPVDVSTRTQGVSESLIEEFMLCANETVARHLSDRKLPGVYRVHEKPSGDKTEALRALVGPLGYNLPDSDSFTLQKILRQAEGKPEQPLIHMLVLRSLMKARYDPENLGHFGLAAPYYCHFTSPIRRYPDLMVHRCLSAALSGAPLKKLASAAGKAAVHSSERELAAAAAEREIEKCYLAEYMQGHIGEEFDAMVSGVTRFGLFVALRNGVEGFLPASALPGGDLSFDETRMTLTAGGGRTRYTFGQALRVVCVSADPAAGQVDFRLTGSERA